MKHDRQNDTCAECIWPCWNVLEFTFFHLYDWSKIYRGSCVMFHIEKPATLLQQECYLVQKFWISDSLLEVRNELKLVHSGCSQVYH